MNLTKLLDEFAEYAKKASTLDAELERLRQENARLRSMLFPYADETQISGISWDGFYLIGDNKSIKEFQRLQHLAAQVQAFRLSCEEVTERAKQKNERLRFKLNAIRKALKEEENNA